MIKFSGICLQRYQNYLIIVRLMCFIFGKSQFKRNNRHIYVMTGWQVSNGFLRWLNAQSKIFLWKKKVFREIHVVVYVMCKKEKKHVRLLRHILLYVCKNFFLWEMEKLTFHHFNVHIMLVYNRGKKNVCFIFHVQHWKQTDKQWILFKKNTLHFLSSYIWSIPLV